MITLVSNNARGMCEWCVNTEEEMESLDVSLAAPSSVCSIIDDYGLRIFLLKSDKSGWTELEGGGGGIIGDGGEIDISKLATKADLLKKVDKIDGKSLSTNDFTDEYKNELIRLMSIKFQNYATKTELTNKVDKIPGKGLSSNDFTTAEKEKLARLKEEEIDTSNFATKDELQNAIDGIVIPDVDLTDYYNKGEVNALIPKVDGFATKKELSDAINGIVIPDVDLTNYYTKTEVDDAIAGIEIPDIDLSDLATKGELDLKVDKVAGMGLSEANFTNEEKTKLAMISIDGGEIDTSNLATKDELALANQKIEELTQIVADLSAKLNTMEEKEFVIESNLFTYNDTTEFYEYTLTHGLNSDKTNITVYELDSGLECLDMCDRVDSNNVLIRNTENVPLLVIVNSCI